MRISSFAERLRQGLLEANMKASELSSITGISKSSISHYLKGDWEGKQDAVLFISKALNVSEAWLMGYDVPKQRSLELLQQNDPADEGEAEEEYLIACRSKDGKRGVHRLTKEEYASAKAFIQTLRKNTNEDL